ncbi:hypothetical protein KR018_010175 [Drosophila ironensis]|nr:hypothetical protein KR018_010175 [Drosophila ironensis]
MLGRDNADCQPQFAEPLKLQNLPRELLYGILSRLEFHHLGLLLNVSRDMRQYGIDLLMHYHQRFLMAHMPKIGESDRARSIRLMMETLNHVGFFVRHMGLDFHYLWGLLHFYEQISRETIISNEECFLPSCLSEFVSHFLESAERPRGAHFRRQQLHQGRLLYIITLIHLLQQFKKFRGLSWIKREKHWEVRMEVGSVYIGAVDQHAAITHYLDLIRRSDFMANIAELLYHESLGRSFCGFKSSGGFVYTYGLQEDPQPKRATFLVLKFVVQAPWSVISLMQAAVSGILDVHKPICMPDCSEFSAHLNVEVKFASRFLAFQPIQVSILRPIETIRMQ